MNLIFPVFFKFINFQDFPAISNHYTTSMPNLEEAQEQFESELVQWMGERYKIWTVILVVIYFVMMSMALLLLILLLSLFHISFHQVQPPNYHCLFFCGFGCYCLSFHWFRFNHPSIIVWVVFNEGWGEYKAAEVSLKKLFSRQKQIKGDKKSYGLGQKPFGGFNEWLGGRGSRFKCFAACRHGHIVVNLKLVNI